MANKIKVGIVGGAGYTGGELLRLLVNHPDVSVSFVDSKSNAGKPLAAVHSDLLGDTAMEFSSVFPMQAGSSTEQVDVLFLCVGHGDAKKFLAENALAPGIKIIDLSQDFRLSTLASATNREFVYGLPELNKELIREASNIANPGCFATAIQLGLLPLAKAGLLGDVYTTGITGSTGAGQSLSNTSHFSWRANNIQAYKTLDHQHLNEIHQSINILQPSFPNIPEKDGPISFIPWRGDFTRGIFISSQTKCDLTLQELNGLYIKFYEGAPFTVVSQQPIFLKQIVNTNKALVQLEKTGNKLVIHSAIDNLLKGASGQAVQNMNLMCGLEETAGLRLKSVGF
ncbi:MAG: N-acetyl-gamma-glutamyl-phosphate reductase [Bacteroidota bacterium]|nr:N-acetyl-gamma-glutamyl-phosphate reductase [Ferruginibacter sp.]